MLRNNDIPMLFFNYTVGLVITVNIIGAYASTIYNFKRPCEDLSQECLTRSLQLALPNLVQGIPELGLEALDPYNIERLDLVLPGGIHIEFKQGIARGLKTCLVDFARYSGNILETQFHCNLTIKGKYKSIGRLLMFPIDGEGDSSIKCYNLKIHNILKLRSITGGDGQKYLEIIGTDTSHSYDGRVTYNMTNIFKGNPEISNAVLDFMNNNWQMVAEEFGGPMVDYGVSSVLKNVRKLFKLVPLDNIVTVPVDL